MPTTGVLNSRLAVIQVGSATITCLVDANLSISMSPRDTTCKDTDSWGSQLPGRLSWEMSGSAMFAWDSTYTFDDLFALINAGTTATIKWGTTVSGDKIYSGTGMLTSLSASSSGVDENVTYDFTFVGTGALTESTNS